MLFKYTILFINVKGFLKFRTIKDVIFSFENIRKIKNDYK